MYFFNLLQVQAKKRQIQMGQVLTHPNQFNGILSWVENICLTKVDNRNSILCKKNKKQKKNWKAGDVEIF